MSNIFKFHHVVGSNINKTYTFNNLIQSPTENITIYEDDMIINIKHKLSSLFDNQSHDEIYLFCKSKDILNQSVYYQILTQDDNIKLTKSIFERFVSNIAINTNFLKSPNKISTKLLKSFYKNKQLWNKETNMIVPIGISAFHKKKYIFNHNPYFCKEEDDVISNDMNKFINTENRKLLFKYKPENNEIYFCFADELLDFFKKQNSSVSEKYLLELYFPNLVANKIKSLQDIQSQKVKLKSESLKIYNSTFKQYNKNIDLLHQYSSKTDNLKYTIKNIYFTIHPNEPLKLPLDIIFKKINSSSLIPLIKYNPGKELESIYRLYTNDFISDKGQKIPSLYVENKESNRKIKQISSNILYNNRIGFYLDLNHLTKSKINEELYCILLSNGDIQIKLNLNNSYNIDELQTILVSIVKKHIIELVNAFIQKKSIYYFKTLNSKNIELNKINVVFSTDSINILSFKNLKCTSSVFSVVNKNQKNNIYDLKYKRVSFYQKMNDIQSFINLKLQEAISIEEIKHMVMNNFNLSQDKAIEILDGFLKETRLAVDAFENRKIKIEDNPGFDIHIETKNTDYINIKLNQLFEISNINDITYITNDIIKRYISALLSINDLDTPLENCIKKVEEKKIETIKEIYENPLDDAKIDFNDDGDDDDLLDLMSGLDDSEDDNNSSKSNKSLSVDSKSIKNNKSINMTNDASDLVRSKSDDSIDLDSLDDELEGSLSLSGGVKQHIDLTSIKIQGSKNWFTNRLRNRQPDVFVLSKEQEKNKNYVKYTKGCPWQFKKQPIILNDEELNKIKKADKKSNSKSFDGLVKYRGYNYICPRYWCFKDDNGESRSISFQQINNGECGGWDAVNPKKSKSLLPGKRIIELTDDRMHNPSKSNNPMVYKPLFPFLQKSENHPKGLCAPCCSQVPLDYEGFPNESEEVRKERKKEQNMYFKHLYTPGNKKGVITIDDSLKNDEFIKKKSAEWEGIGPSFKITKSNNNNIKITNINTTNNDSKQLNKLDLIPKNKTTSKNPSRKDIDNILSKSKNNIRYKTCTSKTMKNSTKKDSPKNIDDEEKQGSREKRDNIPIRNTNTDISIQKTAKKKIKPFLFEFPLKAPDAFGYLKPSLQKFIQYDTMSVCYNNPPNDYSLKPNTKCLLRLGIKKNIKQSFLQNIARLYNKSLKQLKKILIKKITISKYIIAFKGSLIDVFYDKTKKFDNKIQHKIVKSIDDKIVNDFILIKEVGEKLINSYLNFIEYLKDDTINIDYSYLWDFICKPNNKNNAGVLFDKGINLVIFNSPQDDVTDKIEIICPKHTFTSEIFSEMKQTVMLYKEGLFFEPLVLFNNKKGTIKMKFDYDELNSDTLLHSIFSDIKTKIVEGCSLKPSIPEKYDFRKNIGAKELIEKLSKIKNTRVLKQVVHYNYTTIAIIVTISNKNIYIPCHPSSIIIDLDFEYFDSDKLLFDAINTFNLLTTLATKHNIPCLPVKILVTDNINVTGFITETNQMVPTNQFDYDSKLFVIKNRKGKTIPKSKSVINIKENNEHFSDKEIMKMTTEDLDRTLTIRNFMLEKNFYMCYRNILKKEINKETNGNIRQELIDLLDVIYKIKKSDTQKEYESKFKKIKKVVNDLLTDNVVDFVVYQNVILNNLYENVKQDKNICFTNDKSIALPSKNLIDKTSNKEKYLIKIVDELIRYPRLRDYILYSKSITSIDVINYSINNDEIVILEEELFNDYLINVVLKEKNNYINMNQLGFTKPIKTKNYKTEFSLNYNKDTDKDTDNKKQKNKAIPLSDNLINNNLNINVDKYTTTSTDETNSNNCNFIEITSKKGINKHFNNYQLNKELIFHKMNAPYIEGIGTKRKINCTWEVMKAIYSDYFNTEISKQDLCKALLKILIDIHNDKKFVTKPGKVTNIPNYSNILEMSHRRISVIDWPRIEEKEEQQWKHLFSIISNNKEFYLTEFEFYLLCDYFNIPCVIHGTCDNNKELLYKKSKIQYYDPLYTTFNTVNIGKKPEDLTKVKNNLYTNKNNESFCYILGFKQFRLGDYYNKQGIKDNTGFNKYYRNDYNIPFDLGIMMTEENSYKISINNHFITNLLSHSINPSTNEYVDLIFNKKQDNISIYESFLKENKLFKLNKGKKNIKIKSK